ncbi:MAG: hypothetical protein JWQ64_2040 [Subtercola sp.]|nr:hypothetical protein [Subtercola sp.]
MTTSAISQIVVGVIIIVGAAFLIVFRRSVASTLSEMQRSMYGSLGEKVAKNMTPGLVIVGAVAMMIFGMGLIVMGLTGYEYLPPANSSVSLEDRSADSWSGSGSGSESESESESDDHTGCFTVARSLSRTPTHDVIDS